MAIDSVVLGFGYRMRSGKDTCVAEIIKRRSGNGPGWYNIKPYSFAKALKFEVSEMANRSGGMKNLFLRADFPEWVQYDYDAPLDDPYCPYGKQRALLQYWGVYRREQDENYWVKRVAEQVEADRPELALISDLRFKNEFAWIQEYGECIRVDRPGLPPATHVSETELADVSDNQWDAILTNDGTLEELKEAAVVLFDRLLDKVQGVEQGSS
jgi:hypothetical protein